MSLSVGIVGLPNVGKSTLFTALTKNEVLIANYPFATIDPNVGVVEVPDERLQKLSDVSKSKKIIPTHIEFVDIAGLVAGASKGEGLGNQFLANIRETDAILHVLRCFDNENIVHVDGSVNPVRDKEIIDTELQLKDLENVEKRLEKVKRAAKTGNKEAHFVIVSPDVAADCERELDEVAAVEAVPLAGPGDVPVAVPLDADVRRVVGRDALRDVDEVVRADRHVRAAVEPDRVLATSAEAQKASPIPQKIAKQSQGKPAFLSQIGRAHV